MPAAAAQDQDSRRLNLRGTTDSASGENRRNDNVQFNPIDNNALRDFNLRIGASATVIKEFEIQNSYYSTEYGVRPDLPIHIPPTRPSSIHGNIFETHSNSVFSARSFFQVGRVKPAHENNYGFTIGGPVAKGFHFLLDGGQQKARGSVNGNVLVPDANERTPLTSDPKVLPIVVGLLASYPAELPNRTDIDRRALNTNAPQHINTDRLSGTIDRRFGQNNQVLARYSLTSQSVHAFQFVVGQNYDTDVRAHSLRLTWHRTPSANTAVDFSAGFDRVKTVLRPDARQTRAGITIYVIQSIGSSNNPLDRVINDFQYAGQISHNGEKHLWTAGFKTIRRQFNSREANGHRGNFSFGDAFGRDAVTNLRMGTPSRYNVMIGETGRGFRNWDFAFFAGDKWRATPNLTFTFGLRYEAVTVPVEVNKLDVLPFGCDCNNVSPALGIAYRLPGSWGSLRTAYTIQYGQLFPATYGQVRFNPPANIGLAVDVPYLADPLGGMDVTNIDPNTRSSITRISPDLVLPYSHLYNLSWEPGSWKRFRLQLGYVGSRTLKLFSSWSMNRADPVEGIPQILATINLRRPDPNYYMIYRIANGSRAYYDAGRVSVIVPSFLNGSFDLSYWFSKSIDLFFNYPETGFGAVPPPQADSLINDDFKGRSNFDQPHAFLAHGSYNLPVLASESRWLRQVFGGWTFSGVMLLKSGTPFTVFAGSDAPGFGNVDGENGDRITVVDPSILGRTVGDPDTSTTLLPRTAFRFISPTELRGNVGRNTFRKGKIANVNAFLSRTWSFRADKSLTFRAESVNLLNTPQFATPEMNLASSTFARISNTLNVGRNLTFTLRLSF